MIEYLEIAKTAGAANRSVRKDGFRFLAGGTEICRLGSSVKNRKFVSLKQVGLATIGKEDMDFDGKKVNCLKIGAMCTFADLLKSDYVPDSLKVAARYCSSMPKRNMATIGGNIMSCRDDSYLISTLVASMAMAEIMDGSKKQIIELEELLKRKDLNQILLLSVYVRLCHRKVYSKRIANTAASHAALTVAFGACNHDGKLKHPVFFASIKGTGNVRVKCAEKLAESGETDFAAIEQAVKGCGKLKFKSDIFGSAEYKHYLLSVICADLYKAFVQDCKEGE